MTKRCSKCKKVKPIEEFKWQNKAKGLRYPSCRACSSAQLRDYYSRHSARLIRYSTNKTNERRSANYRRIFDYLLAHPCIDCGEGDPIVLDFDHCDGADKRDNVSTLVRSGKFWPHIEREIEKCDVRCANCHRRRTAMQQRWRSVVWLEEIRAARV